MTRMEGGKGNVFLKEPGNNGYYMTCLLLLIIGGDHSQM